MGKRRWISVVIGGGGDLRGRRTRVTMEKEDDWGKEVWNGGKTSEWEERNGVTERRRVDW